MLSFSYFNHVRAASFVRIDRARASVGVSLKKVLDVVAATIAIAVSTPLMLGVPPAIKRENHGPIILRRKRSGLNGPIFENWKFRAMDAEYPDPDARRTSKDHPRVTRADLPKIKKYANKYLFAVLYVWQFR